MPTSTRASAAQTPVALPTSTGVSTCHADAVHDHLLRLGLPAAVATTTTADVLVRGAGRAADGVAGAATLPALLRSAHVLVRDGDDRVIDPRVTTGGAGHPALHHALAGTLVSLPLPTAAAYDLVVRLGLRPGIAADVLQLPRTRVLEAVGQARTALRRTAATVGAGATADVDAIVRGTDVVAAPMDVRHLAAGSPVARRAMRRPLRPGLAWAVAAAGTLLGLLLLGTVAFTLEGGIGRAETVTAVAMDDQPTGSGTLAAPTTEVRDAPTLGSLAPRPTAPSPTVTDGPGDTSEDATVGSEDETTDGAVTPTDETDEQSDDDTGTEPTPDDEASPSDDPAMPLGDLLPTGP